MDSLKEYFCIEITFFSHFYMGLDRRKNLFHLLILRNLIFLPKKAFIALTRGRLKREKMNNLKLQSWVYFMELEVLTIPSSSSGLHLSACLFFSILDKFVNILSL